MRFTKKIRTVIASMMTLSILAGGNIQMPQTAFAGNENTGAWGDLGNGYYNNPVLPADYSDPDIIRVENDYYLITSTFVQSPGITVLHSVDLVNWEIIGGAVKDLTQINPAHNYTVMNSYGRGIWAPCISYNPQNKRFYIHFGDPDYGMFMVYTDDIFSNVWSDVYEVVLPDGTGFGAGWDDCGILWDDDGQGYFAATHFADGYKDYIFKVDQDGYHLQDEGVLVHETDDGLYTASERNPEALKMFKKDGKYYFFHNGVTGGKRKAFIMRADSVYGDYEHIPYPIVEGTREPNQGNLIDIVDDNGDTKWFFWTHQGDTGLDGRPNSLIPITWNSDGWPVAGYSDIKAAGSMVWENIEKPIKNSEIKRPQTSDDFDSDEMGLQWMWNYQPRDGYWSLTENPGHLRLKAFKPLRTDTLNKAGNSLIQRMYRTEGNVVTTKMDIANMTDGQFAGLLYIMGGTAAGIGVYRENGVNYIKFKGTADITGDSFDEDVTEVYLKSEWDNDMLTRSYYSTDGVTYTQFGEEYQITKGNYRGGHIGFFCYNNLSESGYVDFDYFHYEMDVNEQPPVIMGVDDGGVYDLPVTVRYSRGTAAVNGKAIQSGERISGEGEYTVVVTDNGKTSEKTFTLTEDAVEPGINMPFAMNVGGGAEGSFTKDIKYRDGYWGALNGETAEYGGSGIYATGRHAKNLSLQFDGIPEGYYKIKLHFIESEAAAADERVFSVVLQNQLKEDVDIFREAGANTPLVKEYDGIDIDGTLTVDLESVTGDAILCGIEIEEGNAPEKTPRPALVMGEVLIGTQNGNIVEPETFDYYTIKSTEWSGTLTNMSIAQSDMGTPNCGVAPVDGNAIKFQGAAEALRAFESPIKTGQVIFSADYAQGTRMKSISLVDSSGNQVVKIGYDTDSSSAANNNILFINGESVLMTYMNTARSEQMSIKNMVIDVDEGTIEYTVSYSQRSGGSNNWVTEIYKHENIRIRDIAGLLISGEGAGYAGYVDNVVLYSRIPGDGTEPEESPQPEYEVKIDPLSKGVDINENMIGLFFEDINFAADGGLYAEMIKNRSFEFFGAAGSKNSASTDMSMNSWTVTKGSGATAASSIKTDNPIHENNTKYISFDITTAGSGVSLTNTGFSGISLKKGEQYNFSVFARGADYSGDYSISVVKNGKTYAEATAAGEFTSEWKKYTLSFTADDTVDGAQFVLTLKGTGRIDLDMISLFPENTYNNRENGLRADLVQVLKDINPGFLRFPGGCIIEGYNLENRYNWKDSVGPVEERKTNWSRWQNTITGRHFSDYFQSYGLGFYEYFLLCEDLDCEPVPVVNCGMSCQYQSPKELVPLDELDEYIQDALDLVEFANGGVDTEWGALRAEMGHPEPFNLKYIGIGNEQWNQDYFDRYDLFQQAFAEKYPEINLITTSGPDPDGSKYNNAWNYFKGKDSSYAYAVDEHYYKDPEWFFQNVNRYDSFDRNGLKVFAGEYAAHVSDAQPRANSMYAALSEAAFMTGLEKNADIVQMASYAPLFAKEDNWQWTPDMIWFDNSSVYLTPNYYVQKMYSNNMGNYTVSNTAVRTDSVLASTLYTTVSYDEETGDIIIKAVNSADEKIKVNFEINDEIQVRSSGKVSLLYSENPDAYNTLANPEMIKEQDFDYNDFANKFTYELEENSFTVFRIPTGEESDIQPDEGDYTVTASLETGSDIKAAAEIRNNTSEEKTVSAYLAVYSEDGRLIQVSVEEHTIPEDENVSVMMERKLPENAHKVSLYIWEDMKPIYTESKSAA